MSIEDAYGKLVAQNKRLTARLAEAKLERDAAREWIRRHYAQWDVRSPTAHDMRAEMPWLEDEAAKGGE